MNLCLAVLLGSCGVAHGASFAGASFASAPSIGCLHCSRSANILMLAKKPFKGGRLDDFISAGEAEAKYGPGRYAAVAEDAWKLKVREDETEAGRLRTKLEYAAKKSQQLQDHAFLSLLVCAGMWCAFDLKATQSCAVGAAVGALYIYLLQRNVDGIGATTIEEVSKTPPPIIAPVLLVLLVAKNGDTLELLPMLAGFTINQVATLAQIIYPDGWGVAADES